jgi:magnesium transporter
LTFITGFFGQNFAWLVQRVDTAVAFWGLGVGSLLLSCAILFRVLSAGVTGCSRL